MRRKIKMSDLKTGQRIRVARAEYHNVKFGALVTIRAISLQDGDMLVEGPCRFPSGREYNEEQFIELSEVLHIVEGAQ